MSTFLVNFFLPGSRWLRVDFRALFQLRLRLADDLSQTGEAAIVVYGVRQIATACEVVPLPVLDHLGGDERITIP